MPEVGCQAFFSGLYLFFKNRTLFVLFYLFRSPVSLPDQNWSFLFTPVRVLRYWRPGS
jgi:hypothetical protein